MYFSIFACMYAELRLRKLFFVCQHKTKHLGSPIYILADILVLAYMLSKKHESVEMPKISNLLTSG